MVWIKFNSPPLSSFQVHGWGGGREGRRRGWRGCFWFSLGTIFLSFFSAHSGGSSWIPCKCDVAKTEGATGRWRLRGTHPAPGSGRRGREGGPNRRTEERARGALFIRWTFVCVWLWAPTLIAKRAKCEHLCIWFCVYLLYLISSQGPLELCKLA